MVTTTSAAAKASLVQRRGVSLASAAGYWLMPRVWALGHEHGHVTQADFFVRRYGATWLGVLVGVVGIAALVGVTLWIGAKA